MASKSAGPDSGDHTAISVHTDHESASLDADVVRALVRHTLERHLGEGHSFEGISIILSNRSAIHEMNREFLGHDYPTDVLSFLLTDASPHEGEVYIDLDMASDRCDEFGSSYEAEAYRYIIHGVLHLLGMDDSTPMEKDKMHLAENQILETLPE